MMEDGNGKAVWLQTLDSNVKSLDDKVDKLLEGQVRLQERESRVDSLEKRSTSLEITVNTLSNQIIQAESEKATKEKMHRLWLGIYVAVGTVIATIFGPLIAKLLGGT